jgi:glycosyltransferase involved in cell wall biosynthesis
MKIVIDGRFYGLENAGLGRYTINLIKELQNIDNKNQYFVLLRKKYFDQLKVPSNWKKISADYKHYSLAEQIKLPKLISSLRPDLVHFLHFNIPIFYKEPFVVTIHDILMHRQRGLEATTLFPLLYWIKRLAYGLVFRQAVRGSKKIITPSKAIKREVVDYYKLDPGKIAVTYEGLDEEILEGENQKKILGKYYISNPYFIYAGNAYPHKNLKRAIEAALLLNKEREERVLLVLVSARNIFVERIEKLVKKMGAEEYVKVLDLVSDKELGVLFKNSLAFVFPSLSEGFGLPGLEAMGAGTLLIASDIPIFKEIYLDQAIYFNPYDFTSIEKSMEDVIKMEKEERKEIILASQIFIKRYSWRKMAEETLNVYKSCLSL